MFEKLSEHQVTAYGRIIGKTIENVVNSEFSGVIFFTDDTFYVTICGRGSRNSFCHSMPFNEALKKWGSYDTLSNILFEWSMNAYWKPIISESGTILLEKGYVTIDELIEYYMLINKRNRDTKLSEENIRKLIKSSIAINMYQRSKDKLMVEDDGTRYLTEDKEIDAKLSELVEYKEFGTEFENELEIED